MISIVSTNSFNYGRKLLLNTKTVLLEHFHANIRQDLKARFVTEE